MSAVAVVEYRRLSDRELAFLVEQLEVGIAAMRMPTTRAAAALLQQYRDRLDAVRAEQERRRC